jgi:hypothetical protein
MPEICKCGSITIEQYQDNLKRNVRKFACGSVWLEPTPAQAIAVYECEKIRNALDSIKQWVETRQ